MDALITIIWFFCKGKYWVKFGHAPARATVGHRDVIRGINSLIQTVKCSQFKENIRKKLSMICRSHLFDFSAWKNWTFFARVGKRLS